MEFWRTLDSGGAGRVAGAVVAAARHAPAAAPDIFSASAPAAGIKGRAADAGPHALVAAAVAHRRGGLVDCGAGRSAAGPRPQAGGQRTALAGDRQWLERRQRLE